jgi:hypothetical protein
MACSGLPANTQCTFLPATVAFIGTNLAPQNVTLTITTATPPPTTVAGWLFPFGVLMLLGAWRYRKSLAAQRSFLTIAFALGSSLAILAVSGCGNGSSSNATPAGTSTVTVTLIGTPNGTTTVPTSGTGNIPKTFTFSLTVK